MANKLRYGDFSSRIDIDAFEDAIDFEPIEEHNGEDRGFCPLPYNAHSNGDTTGKFSINRDKRIYNCWVCGGGSLLDLAMAIKDLDPEPATKWIYQFANHEETDDEFLEHLDELLADPAEQRTPTPYFNNRVLDRYEQAGDHQWIRDRGIDPEISEQFKIRYNPLARRTIKEDTYEGPSLIFPHFWQGRLVGWQQRWLDPEDVRPKWVPKYTMTPDFPKNETLFAYGDAMANVQDEFVGKPNPIVVCESVPSVLFLWSNYQPAVATFGSSVHEAQMKLLRRFPKVILAPDNDDAGEKWTRSLQTYLERYIEVSVLPVLDGKGSDIGDLAEDPSVLKDYLSLAYNSLDTVL